MGKNRNDGKVAGTGLLGESRGASGGKGRSNGMDEHTIRSNYNQVEEPPKSLDASMKELEAHDHRKRAAGKDDLVGENSSGDLVVLAFRTSIGWGKCKHLSPDTKEECCIKERFSERTPFCKEHLEFWRDMRRKNESRKIFEEEVSQFKDLSKENFFFKTAQDIMDFLSRLNFAVYKNWLPIGKARALSNIARVQIKALDSKIIAHRLHAILAGLEKGNGQSTLMSVDDVVELENDIERGRMMGLGDLVKHVSERLGDQQNRYLDPKLLPPHPDMKTPDPEFPAHPEDSKIPEPVSGAVDTKPPGG